MRKAITFDSFIRTSAIILGVILIIKVIDYLSAVLVPFFVAWFVAYLVFPIVEFFQIKLRFHFRVLAIIATMLMLAGFCILMVWLILPPVIEDFSRFAKVADNYISDTAHHNEVEQYIIKLFGNVDVSKMLHDGQLLELIRSATPKIWNFVQHTAGVIISIISWSMSIIYMFFILYDYERISQSWRKFVPHRYHSFANGLFKDLKQGMNAYFRGQFIIALCVGILYCIGVTIINFPLAIPLGILIGVLSFIPYLHALGLVPTFFLCVLKSAETGQNFWLILLAAISVFLIIQAIQDIILTPKIMGDAIGLPPYLILLSLSVWGFLLGIIGMIIALPLTTIIVSYYNRYLSKRRKEITQTE